MDAVIGLVFAAGDLAYPTGSASDFAECFDPTWGRFRSRMLAAPGNHEYLTADASGFFDDLGAAAGPRGSGYFATDVGAWRIYVLNANCGIVSCDAASAQVAWLRADLEAEPRDRVAAIWHQPRFSSGPHGDAPETSAFWDVLYRAGAELVINGHDHIYERFVPQDPAGRVDDRYGHRHRRVSPRAALVGRSRAYESGTGTLTRASVPPPGFGSSLSVPP